MMAFKGQAIFAAGAPRRLASTTCSRSRADSVLPVRTGAHDAKMDSRESRACEMKPRCSSGMAAGAGDAGATSTTPAKPLGRRDAMLAAYRVTHEYIVLQARRIDNALRIGSKRIDAVIASARMRFTPALVAGGDRAEFVR